MLIKFKNTPTLTICYLCIIL